MMIIVNFNGNRDQGGVISGSVNGQPFGVSFDAEKYQKMKELEAKANSVDTMEELKQIVEEFLPLTQESYKEIVETKSPYIVVNRHTNKFYLRYNDVVSSQPLPQVFVDKIIKSVEKDIDIEPLIKCWARYMRPVKGRPTYNIEAAKLFAQYIDADYVNGELVAKFQKEGGLSPEVAQERGTTKQVAITQEGLLVCYKVSTEIDVKYVLDEETEQVKTKSRYALSVDPDSGEVTKDIPKYVEDRLFEPRIMSKGGDPFFCSPAYEKPGHFIKVGNLHYLDSWDKVSYPGSKGLHVGGLRYIQGYQSKGTVTHNVFVDPMHIYGIAGLGIGNDGAMTVKQYFVHSSFAGPNKNIYHSSKYAALTDAEFAEIVKEAVEATRMAAEEAGDLLRETIALVPRDSPTATDILKG